MTVEEIGEGERLCMGAPANSRLVRGEGELMRWWLVLAELAATSAEFAGVDDGLLVLRRWLWSESEEEHKKEDVGWRQQREEGDGLGFIRVRVKLMRVYIEKGELG